MIRLFAAVRIPDEIAEGLARRQIGLDGARWRTADQLHITLRFFGELREDVARDLDAELAAVGGAPFDLVLEGAGAFGEGGDIPAIWAGVADNPELRRLAKACETAARRAGLKPEGRQFRPHVTLAYLRRADPDKDRIRLGSQHLHPPTGDGTGDANLPLPFAADHAVGRNGKLENHIGAAADLAHEIGFERPLPLFRENADINGDTGIAQAHDAAPGDALVRIEDRDHHAGNAGCDEWFICPYRTQMPLALFRPVSPTPWPRPPLPRPAAAGSRHPPPV